MSTPHRRRSTGGDGVKTREGAARHWPIHQHGLEPSSSLCREHWAQHRARHWRRRGRGAGAGGGKAVSGAGRQAVSTTAYGHSQPLSHHPSPWPSRHNSCTPSKTSSTRQKTLSGHSPPASASSPQKSRSMVERVSLFHAFHPRRPARSCTPCSRVAVKIVKVLGEGGFSFVYLAQDEHSGVRVHQVAQ